MKENQIEWSEIQDPDKWEIDPRIIEWRKVQEINRVTREVCERYPNVLRQLADSDALASLPPTIRPERRRANVELGPPKSTTN